ncbi:MAG: hypothetical protein CME64_09970 [Halobacteriovoraceae bacterium]|nr:hypothetical protein [Halobacteriovoraceae bacterium]|tara:strand:+ start:84288 stop:84665 length:378 start_codon:yes stop_codon:yes gene_type:complete
MIVSLFSTPIFASGNREQIQDSMLDRTKDALMSYEIVEEKSKEVMSQIKAKVENSAIGKYKTTIAAAVPIVTGKVAFSYGDLRVSYSAQSARTKLDYRLGERWKVFHRSEKDDGERTGVDYSVRF